MSEPKTVFMLSIHDFLIQTGIANSFNWHLALTEVAKQAWIKASDCSHCHIFHSL